MTISPRIVAWLPVAAGVLVSVLAVSLAQWQLGRADQKRATQARWDDGARQVAQRLDRVPDEDESWLYRRIRVQGEFVPGYQIYLDNRIYAGRAGYHVVAPLRMAGSGGAILVNRGWLQGDADRRNAPFVQTPKGPVQLEGILVRARGRYLELSGQTVQGMVWQNLDLDRYRTLYAQPLPNWLLLQGNDLGDGLVRDWPRPDVGVDKHISYAGQWFALAATGLALTLIYLWRLFRGRK